MTSSATTWTALVLSVLLVSRNVAAFIPQRKVASSSGCTTLQNTSPSPYLNNPTYFSQTSTTSTLRMSKKDGGGGSLTTPLIGLFLGGAFLSTSIMPMLMASSNGGGVAPLSDAVVTRQSPNPSLTPQQTNQYRLSRSAIQEKVSGIPVFYAVGEDGDMSTDIYLSYDDAKELSPPGQTIKATTMDQVLYPLVLQRGRMRMDPPPVEVETAEAKLSESGKKYHLIPSKQAKEDAIQFKMELADSDIPLFVTDRLAFADMGGLQLPLFLEQRDCITSYNRLRESNKKLPEEPTIQSTSLMDELVSMEKGTRPGMTQLAFYATAEDVNQAVKMIDGE